MKFPPNYIIYKQALRYLAEDEKSALKDLLQFKNYHSKVFLNILLRYFDNNRFKDSPLIWQDIWLFNYIKYDVTDKIKRSGLIAKYEKEIFIENDEEFFLQMESLNNRKL